MYYYIVNPAAGGAKINKIQDRLKDRLSRLGIMGEFAKSTGPDDVARLTRIGIERGYKTIVAVGGDGTINEVMNTILKIGDNKIALGIIPTGTTNNLADALGIKDWYGATSILASRKIEQVDLGLVGNRFFVTSATVGFDPRVSEIKRLSRGNLLDKLRFSLGVFREATTFKPVKAFLRFDKNYEVEAECFNVIVSNAQFFPYSNVKTAPQDSLLDTVVITKISGSKVLKYGYWDDPKLIEQAKISVFHSKEIEIDAQNAVEVTADGQVIGKTPIIAKMSDKKLRLIVSRKRKF